MSLRTTSIVLAKMLFAILLLSLIAWISTGGVRLACAATACVLILMTSFVHRLLWRCPSCHHRLGAALGRYCTWCGEKLHR